MVIELFLFNYEQSKNNLTPFFKQEDNYLLTKALSSIEINED